MFEGPHTASVAVLSLALLGCTASRETSAPSADVAAPPTCDGPRICDLQGRAVFCQAGETPTLLETCAEGAACLDGACVCQPDCTGRGCGDDGCGGTCGSCESLSTCEGGVCAPVCDPKGTGSGLGDVVASLEFTADPASPDLDGTGRWSLAQRCTRGATLFIESAVWCDTCAPALDAALAAFGDRPDVQIVVVLGETTPGVPPTSLDLSAYRESMAIPASIPVLLDPLFGSLAVAVDHAGGGLPFFIWLHEDLRLVARGLMGDAPDFPELVDLPPPFAREGE